LSRNNSRDTDGDGLPFIDDATLKEWRAEALRNLPAPNDMADLLVLLRWNAQVDREGIENAELPNGLTACERSISAILAFLQNQNFSQTHGGSEPLTRLHAGILDIADGIAPALFKPKKRHAGRPGKGITYAALQGLAARTLTELIEGGGNKFEAANRVAKSLKKPSTDMQDVTGETVTNWRERIVQGVGPGAPAEAVAHYKEPLPLRLGSTPKMRGENLLKIIAERGAVFG
jgi:hypothetical protein